MLNLKGGIKVLLLSIMGRGGEMWSGCFEVISKKWEPLLALLGSHALYETEITLLCIIATNISTLVEEKY